MGSFCRFLAMVKGAFALIAGAQGPHSTLPHKEDVWNIKAMDSMLHKAATLQATSRHVPPDQTRLAGKSQVWSCRAGAPAAASWLAGLHQYYFQSSPLYFWWGYISMVNIELVPSHASSPSPSNFLSSRTRSPWFFEVPGHNPPGPIQCLKDACSHLLWRQDLGSNLVWFRTKGTELAPPTARPFIDVWQHQQLSPGS